MVGWGQAGGLMARRGAKCHPNDKNPGSFGVGCWRGVASPPGVRIIACGRGSKSTKTPRRQETPRHCACGNAIARRLADTLRPGPRCIGTHTILAFPGALAFQLSCRPSPRAVSKRSCIAAAKPPGMGIAPVTRSPARAGKPRQDVQCAGCQDQPAGPGVHQPGIHR